MAATIKFKRGASDNVSLAAGEPAFNTSASKFFIGTNGTNKTWVGAEIEPTATVDWTDPSDSKLATQLAIQNYVLGEGSINAKVTNNISAQEVHYPMFITDATDNAAPINVDMDSLTFTPSTNTFRVGPVVTNRAAITGGNSVYYPAYSGASLVSTTSSFDLDINSFNSPTLNLNLASSSILQSDQTLNVSVATTGVAGSTANFVFGSNNQTNGSFTSHHNVIIAREKSLRFNDADNNAYVGFKAPSEVPTSYTLILPDTLPNMGGKGGTPTRPLVSDASGNLTWGEFNSETTTFNIADSSDNSAELNLVLTEFNSGTAGQGSALIDTAAGTSGQDGGIKYNPSTNTLTTSVFRVREGTTAAYISIDAPTGTTSYSFTLPTTGGEANYVLKTDGSGNTSWTEVIEKANKVHVTDTPGTVGLNGFEAVYYPSFYEDSSSQSTNFYATRVDEKAYEVKPTRNRFTLKTGELPVGISRWTTCSTGAGNCQSGILPPPDVGGTGVDPGTTDSSGGGGTTDSSGGGGTTDSSGGGVTPGETGFDTPSSEDVGNFGVGELEFSARNLSTDVETGYLRFSINPALTQHISYVLPDTLPTPGQFLAVGETNFEKDSDLGDVRQLTWTNSAGEVNVAEATPDNLYNAAYSLVFAAGGSGGSKGLLFDLDNNDGGLSWNPSSNVLKAGRVQLNTGITESGGGTTTGAISLEPISSATGANVNLFASTTGTITLGASDAVVLVPSITVGSSDNAAVNKAYVDGVAAGIHFHAACRLATADNVALPNCTYSKADGSNNANGIGDYLQATGNGPLSVDSVAVAVGDRILVKNQANPAHNGIYTVTVTGGASAQWRLTRAEDFDTDVEIAGGDFTFVTHGATNANSGWVQTGTTHTSIGGSSAITFVQFAGAANYTASNGIRRDINEFKLASGVNTDTSLAMGKILYGNGNYVGSLDAGTSTYVLQANGAAAPSWVEGPAKVNQTAVTVANSDYYLTFTGTSSTGYDNIEVSSQLKYNPSGTYTAGTLNETNKHVLSIASGNGYLDAIIDGGTYGN